MTHSMLLKLVVKYVWICGMAMFTMVPSSRIMNRPRHRTASTAQGLRARGALVWRHGRSPFSSAVSAARKATRVAGSTSGKAREDRLQPVAPALQRRTYVRRGGGRDFDCDDAAVGRRDVAAHETLGDQAFDHLAGRGPAHREAVGQLAHGLPAAAGELDHGLPSGGA